MDGIAPGARVWVGQGRHARIAAVKLECGDGILVQLESNGSYTRVPRDQVSLYKRRAAWRPELPPDFRRWVTVGETPRRPGRNARLVDPTNTPRRSAGGDRASRRAIWRPTPRNLPVADPRLSGPACAHDWVEDAAGVQRCLYCQKGRDIGRDK